MAQETSGVVELMRVIILSTISVTLIHAVPTNRTLLSSLDPGKSLSSSHSITPSLPSSYSQGDHSSYDSFSLSSLLSSSHGSQQGPAGCHENQFWNITQRSCMNCTVCSEGSEHKHYNLDCGFGSGVRDSCIPCKADFFQDKTSHTGVTCKPCKSCDTHAEVLAECSATKDTECGPCPDGTYPFQENICVECETEADSPSCKGHVKPSTQSASKADLDLSTGRPPSPPSNETEEVRVGKPVYRLAIVGYVVVAVAPIAVVIIIVVLWKRRHSLLARCMCTHPDQRVADDSPKNEIPLLPMTPSTEPKPRTNNGDGQKTLQYPVERQDTPEVDRKPEMKLTVTDPQPMSATSAFSLPLSLKSYIPLSLNENITPESKDGDEAMVNDVDREVGDAGGLMNEDAFPTGGPMGLMIGRNDSALGSTSQESHALDLDGRRSTMEDDSEESWPVSEPQPLCSASFSS